VTFRSSERLQSQQREGASVTWAAEPVGDKEQAFWLPQIRNALILTM